MGKIKDITEKEFNNIREYVKKNFGINLSDEKKSLVYSRLNNVLTELDIDNFSDYYDILCKDKTGKLSKVFIDKITTNHTYFMRETEHFSFLTREVLPYLKSKNINKKDVRVWCAGCSSGEEAYTLEILLLEFFGENSGWDLQLLATDISSSVLKKASKGIYTIDSLKNIPKEWTRKYFDEYDDKNMIVKKILKDKIIFRKFNLIQERFSFKKPINIIFCRNVMIYFDNNTRENLVNRFYDVTENNGYFFIGHSESLNNTNTKYKYITPAVYRK